MARDPSIKKLPGYGKPVKRTSGKSFAEMEAIGAAGLKKDKKKLLIKFLGGSGAPNLKDWQRKEIEKGHSGVFWDRKKYDWAFSRIPGKHPDQPAAVPGAKSKYLHEASRLKKASTGQRVERDVGETLAYTGIPGLGGLLGVVGGSVGPVKGASSLTRPIEAARRSQAAGKLAGRRRGAIDMGGPKKPTERGKGPGRKGLDKLVHKLKKKEVVSHEARKRGRKSAAQAIEKGKATAKRRSLKRRATQQDKVKKAAVKARQREIKRNRGKLRRETDLPKSKPPSEVPRESREWLTPEDIRRVREDFILGRGDEAKGLTQAERQEQIGQLNVMLTDAERSVAKGGRGVPYSFDPESMTPQDIRIDRQMEAGGAHVVRKSGIPRAKKTDSEITREVFPSAPPAKQMEYPLQAKMDDELDRIFHEFDIGKLTKKQADAEVMMWREEKQKWIDNLTPETTSTPPTSLPPLPTTSDVARAARARGGSTEVSESMWARDYPSTQPPSSSRPWTASPRGPTEIDSMIEHAANTSDWPEVARLKYLQGTQYPSGFPPPAAIPVTQPSGQGLGRPYSTGDPSLSELRAMQAERQARAMAKVPPEVRLANEIAAKKGAAPLPAIPVTQPTRPMGPKQLPEADGWGSWRWRTDDWERGAEPPTGIGPFQRLPSPIDRAATARRNAFRESMAVPLVTGTTLVGARIDDDEEEFQSLQHIEPIGMPDFTRERAEPIKRSYPEDDLTGTKGDEAKGKFPGLKVRSTAAAKRLRDLRAKDSNKAKKEQLDAKRQEKRYPSKDK